MFGETSNEVKSIELISASHLPVFFFLLNSVLVMSIISKKPCDALFRVTLPGKGHEATPLSSGATAPPRGWPFCPLLPTQACDRLSRPSRLPSVLSEGVDTPAGACHQGDYLRSQKPKHSPLVLSVSLLRAAKRPPLCFDWAPLLVSAKCECF